MNVFFPFLPVIILCILQTSLVPLSSVVSCALSFSLMDDSALRFFLVFPFFDFTVVNGVVSGELSGLFCLGLPFGGVVSGISVSCFGHRSVVSICGRSPYFLMFTVV